VPTGDVGYKVLKIGEKLELNGKPAKNDHGEKIAKWGYLAKTVAIPHIIVGTSDIPGKTRASKDPEGVKS